MKVQATARVQVTVDIDVPDTWGEDCTVSQVHAQAATAALGILRRMKEQNRRAPYSIIGEPRVIYVSVDRSTLGEGSGR